MSRSLTPEICCKCDNGPKFLLLMMSDQERCTHSMKLTLLLHCFTDLRLSFATEALNIHFSFLARLKW